MLMKYVRGDRRSFLQRQMVREDFSGHLSEHRDGIGNDRATEFATACGQVERIALLRLKDILP